MAKMNIPTGTMSNLVGMWALIFKEEDKNVLRVTAYISGKCGSSNDGNDYYIVQAINALTGEPSTAKIFRISDMGNWVFLPTKEIAETVLNDYWATDSKRFRYHFPDVK